MKRRRRRSRPARRSRLQRFIVCAAIAQTGATGALAAETCRFVGTTDYAGHVWVTTTATAVRDVLRLDVVLRFEAVTALWLPLRYLVEEVSTWRGGALLGLDVNTRTLFADRIVRQQWDEFRPAREGFQGYRIEGKRPAEFRRQYPHFAMHWAPATFGLPWLDDYADAQPVRRPDLDLDTAAQSVRPPFALAFYWVRFLHPGRQHDQVFLPGFKRDKLADLAITAVHAAVGQAWRAELHNSYLTRTPPSSATAQLSADEHLQALSFELHGSAGAARGVLRETGCFGIVGR